eukprot:XP_001701013.1 leucine-rich repeat protein [Chlamydomonas reinhardtii]
MEQYRPLRDLILSNNRFNGSLAVPDCDSLITLDGQNNNFSGPLPDFSTYRQLHILRLGNNSFNGSVLVSGFELRLLAVLDLSNNYRYDAATGALVTSTTFKLTDADEGAGTDNGTLLNW